MCAMRTRTAALLAASIALSAPPLRAQEPAAPEFLKNTSFSNFDERGNFWTGVNPDGVLAGSTVVHFGWKPGPPILTAEGGIDNRPMPISVALDDLNADGLLDIAAMENPGYLRVYFNSGTPQQPKFDKGELAPFYISRVANSDPTLSWISNPNKNKDFWFVRQTNRIHFSDILRSGKKNLLIGNYAGELFLVPNTGSSQKPEFRSPADLARVMIHTSGDAARKWGNIFSPATVDWNRDGKDDLLIGEGSYSANSIHLLLNQGSANAPKFDETAKHVLAYGMGLEQLTPCLVDFNGDGKTDLLVTESGGKVAVYLNKSDTWKPGETIPMDSFLKVGGNDLSLGGISTVAAGDLTGDGLFDLVFGKNNGCISMTINSGTKESPKFDSVQDVKSTSPGPRIKQPHFWWLENGSERGNFYGTISIVNAADDPGAQIPEGDSCLKVFYTPSPNTVMAPPEPRDYNPPLDGFRKEDINVFYEDEMQNLRLNSERGILEKAAANYFVVMQGGHSPLVPGKTYTASMKVRGNDVPFASMYLGAAAKTNFAQQQATAGDRGAVRKKMGQDRNSVSSAKKFSPSDKWSDVSLDFTVRFNDARIAREFNTQAVQVEWNFVVVAELEPGKGVLYIDDVSISEKK